MKMDLSQRLKGRRYKVFGVLILFSFSALVLFFYSNCSGIRTRDSGFETAGTLNGLPSPTPPSSVSVVQYHNQGSRAGLYVDPAFTKAASAHIHLDSNFLGTVSGNVYAQPLFLNGAGQVPDLVFAVTESNNVTALDAISGQVVWNKNFGAAVTSGLSCGNIRPLGITGTPVIDPQTRTLYFDVMTSSASSGIQHLIYAISADDGSLKTGWPLDVSAKFTDFSSKAHNQRGALAIVNGVLYVPYGGHFGDCDNYRGWLISVPLSDPKSAVGWHTAAAQGGIWAPSGVATDGTSLFVATGNTGSANVYGQGESIIRFTYPPTFTNSTTDYYAPKDWQQLDATDLDLGGSGVMLFDAPGATPSKLVLSLGKDGFARALDRANLGGISDAVTSLKITSGELLTAPTTYTTSRGTFVAFDNQTIRYTPPQACPSGQSGELIALKVTATNPPHLLPVWCANQNGNGAPITTTVDGSSQAIVWSIGAEGSNRLYGFDGETGQAIFNGGGPQDAMTDIQHFQTPIVAKGRIYVAGNGKIYSFTLK